MRHVHVERKIPPKRLTLIACLSLSVIKFEAESEVNLVDAGARSQTFNEEICRSHCG